MANVWQGAAGWATSLQKAIGIRDLSPLAKKHHERCCDGALLGAELKVHAPLEGWPAIIFAFQKAIKLNRCHMMKQIPAPMVLSPRALLPMQSLLSPTSSVTFHSSQLLMGLVGRSIHFCQKYPFSLANPISQPIPFPA